MSGTHSVTSHIRKCTHPRKEIYWVNFLYIISKSMPKSVSYTALFVSQFGTESLFEYPQELASWVGSWDPLEKTANAVAGAVSIWSLGFWRKASCRDGAEFSLRRSSGREGTPSPWAWGWRRRGAGRIRGWWRWPPGPTTWSGPAGSRTSSWW